MRKSDSVALLYGFIYAILHAMDRQWASQSSTKDSGLALEPLLWTAFQVQMRSIHVTVVCVAEADSRAAAG